VRAGACLRSPAVAANGAAALAVLVALNAPFRDVLGAPGKSGAARLMCLALQAYAAAEVAWYLFCESEKERFQPLAVPFKLAAERRRSLWELCLRWSPNPRLWIQGWFYNIEQFERITREDILDFIAWGYWGCPSIGLEERDKAMLVQMISELELACSTSAAPSYKFPDRKAGQEVLPVGSYTLEPMRSLHVPLLVYVVMHGIVDPLTTCLLSYHGLVFLLRLLLLSRWRIPLPSPPLPPLSPPLSASHVLTKNVSGFETFRPASSAGTISFSVRRGGAGDARAAAPASGCKGTALMVVHGIGIGALPYWGIIKALMHEGPIIVAHHPYVSVRWAPSCPDISQTVCAYAEVMAAYELDGACILSHSFGTAITSWLVQYRPELVRGVVLLDPAVLCIHLRKLLFNFIYARQALDSVPVSAAQIPLLGSVAVCRPAIA